MLCVMLDTDNNPLLELKPDTVNAIRPLCDFGESLNDTVRRLLGFDNPQPEASAPAATEPVAPAAPVQRKRQTRRPKSADSTPAPPPATNKEKKSKRAGGLLPSEYELPTLRFLVASGGTALRKDLKAHLLDVLSDRMTDADFAPSPGKQGTPIWLARLTNMRSRAIQRGFIDPDTQHGTWGVTPAGAAFVEERDGIAPVVVAPAAASPVVPSVPEEPATGAADNTVDVSVDMSDVDVATDDVLVSA